MLTKTDNFQELYETDYILWLEKNIKAMKDGKLYCVDFEHLIEELETLSATEKRRVKSFLKQLLLHLLIYQYWTTEYNYNAHHWSAEIYNFRDELKDDLKSKILYNYLISELDNIYTSASELAKRKSGLNCFPELCPYSFDQILDQNWLPSISNQ